MFRFRNQGLPLLAMSLRPYAMKTVQVLLVAMAVSSFGSVAPGRAERRSPGLDLAPRQHAMHTGDHRTWCALHSMRKEFRLAIEDCDELLQLNPTDADALSDRGSAYFLAGEPDRAIIDFNDAIRIAPLDASNYYNRAIVYTRKREPLHALLDFNEAIRLDPKYAASYNNRGQIFEALGYQEQAIADYRKAFEFGSLSHMKVIAQKNLQRLGAKP